MITRARLRPALVAILGLLVPPAANAGELPVETVLLREPARPVDSMAPDPVTPCVTLVYSVPRGEFAGRLDAILAEASAASGTDPRSEARFAQAVEDSIHPRSPAAGERREEQPDLLLPVLGGLVGGAAGLYGGAYLGYVVTGDDDGELGIEEFTGLITGAALGEMLGVSAGAHLGNARKGSFAKDVLTAALSGIAGWGLVFATESGAVAALAGVLHLGLVVATERREGSRRIEERSAGGAGSP